MKVVGDAIISDSVFDTNFCCDLKACKGACCVEGDAGAPLEEVEISQLEDYIDIIKDYMTEKGIAIIEEQGVFDYDAAGEMVTPLVNDQECAFVNWDEKDIAYCAIEKAWFDKKIKFRKPVSCHLYPIRLHKYKTFTAVNYHEWPICKPALKLGGKKKISVKEFTKDALIRKFGEDWFNQL